MESERGPRASASTWIVLGLTLLAACLRFYRLTNQSIWVDEAFTIKYARLFTEMHWSWLTDDLHGPFHSVLLHGWASLFGTGEFALRAMEAVLGTLAVPAFYWALRPLQRPTTALLAVGLLAINPFHIWYSQELRNYDLFILVGILTTGAFARVLQREHRYGALYGALTTLGFLSNLAHLFTVVAQGLVQVFRGGKGRGEWRGLILSWGLSLLLLSPWIYGFYSHRIVESRALEARSVPAEERLRGETTAPVIGIPYCYFVYSVGYSYGPSLRELRGLHQSMGMGPLRRHAPQLALAGVIFGFLAIVGVIRVWRFGLPGRVWLVLLLVPVLLTYATALRNLKVFNPRYASAALPPYMLVLAEGILAARNRRLRFAAAGALLIPTGMSLSNHYFDDAYAKDDARSASTFLRERVEPGDLVFVIGTDEPLHRYYWRGIRENPDGITKGDVGYWWDRPRAEQFVLFEELRAEHDDAYVLLLRDHFVDPAGEWRQYLNKWHTPTRREVYPGSEVWSLPSQTQTDATTGTGQ